MRCWWARLSRLLTSTLFETTCRCRAGRKLRSTGGRGGGGAEHRWRAEYRWAGQGRGGAQVAGWSPGDGVQHKPRSAGGQGGGADAPMRLPPFLLPELPLAEHECARVRLRWLQPCRGGQPGCSQQYMHTPGCMHSCLWHVLQPPASLCLQHHHRRAGRGLNPAQPARHPDGVQGAHVLLGAAMVGLRLFAAAVVAWERKVDRKSMSQAWIERSQLDDKPRDQPAAVCVWEVESA